MNKLFLLIPLMIGCTATDVNYKYDFSAVYTVDRLGRAEWGGHQFVVDEPITNINSFKECYVNYLNEQKGIGRYKQIYYNDSNNIQITFMKETYVPYHTVEYSLNSCNKNNEPK